jgi:hypothetical protein
VCLQSREGTNIVRSSAAKGRSPVHDRRGGAIDELPMIAYRPEARWPKQFHRALAIDMHPVLRRKPALRFRRAGMTHIYEVMGDFGRGAIGTDDSGGMTTARVKS